MPRGSGGATRFPLPPPRTRWTEPPPPGRRPRTLVAAISSSSSISAPGSWSLTSAASRVDHVVQPHEQPDLADARRVGRLARRLERVAQDALDASFGFSVFETGRAGRNTRQLRKRPKGVLSDEQAQPAARSPRVQDSHDDLEQLAERGPGNSSRRAGCVLEDLDQRLLVVGCRGRGRSGRARGSPFILRLRIGTSLRPSACTRFVRVQARGSAARRPRLPLVGRSS